MVSYYRELGRGGGGCYLSDTCPIFYHRHGQHIMLVPIQEKIKLDRFPLAEESQVGMTGNAHGCGNCILSGLIEDVTCVEARTSFVRCILDGRHLVDTQLLPRIKLWNPAPQPPAKIVHSTVISRP